MADQERALPQVDDDDIDRYIWDVWDALNAEAIEDAWTQ